MKKNRIILTLSLVFVLMFYTVVGCGNSSQLSGETTKEETKTLESTTAADSTTQEATTVGEQVHSLKMHIDYSIYPISEETKAMLIEKFTNLELVKGDKFDVYSLPFKENELQACYILESILAHYMFSYIDNTGVLECDVSKFKIAKVVDEEKCLRFYMEIIY